MSRTLSPPPARFRAPTGAIALGSYAGPLPAIDFRHEGTTRRLIREKRWLFVALTTPGLWVSVAVVKTGYAATRFGYAYDTTARRLLASFTELGPPTRATVAADPHQPGLLASFGDVLTATRTDAGLDLRVTHPSLVVEASIHALHAPSAIAAIAEVGRERVSATEKRALLSTRGIVRAGDRTYRLEGGLAGYDYTHGHMPRRTRWRWAFGMGRTPEGAPVGFNLVEGFMGEAECASFGAGNVHPLGEGRFDFDAAHPERPWRIEGDGVDLTFEPGAVHRQTTRLLVVRSRFLQPIGVFRGTVRVGDRDVCVDGFPGVTEDQDATW